MDLRDSLMNQKVPCTVKNPQIAVTMNYKNNGRQSLPKRIFTKRMQTKHKPISLTKVNNITENSKNLYPTTIKDSRIQQFHSKRLHENKLNKNKLNKLLMKNQSGDASKSSAQNITGKNDNIVERPHTSEDNPTKVIEKHVDERTDSLDIVELNNNSITTYSNAELINITHPMQEDTKITSTLDNANDNVRERMSSKITNCTSSSQITSSEPDMHKISRERTSGAFDKKSATVNNKNSVSLSDSFEKGFTFNYAVSSNSDGEYMKIYSPISSSTSIQNDELSVSSSYLYESTNSEDSNTICDKNTSSIQTTSIHENISYIEIDEQKWSEVLEENNADSDISNWNPSENSICTSNKDNPTPDENPNDLENSEEMLSSSESDSNSSSFQLVKEVTGELVNSSYFADHKSSSNDINHSEQINNDGLEATTSTLSTSTVQTEVEINPASEHIDVTDNLPIMRTHLNPNIKKLDFMLRFKVNLGDRKSLDLKIGNTEQNVIHFYVERNISFTSFKQLVLSYDQYINIDYLPSDNDFYMGKNTSTKESNYLPIINEIEFNSMINACITYKKSSQKIVRLCELKNIRTQQIIPVDSIHIQPQSIVVNDNSDDTIPTENIKNKCELCHRITTILHNGKCVMHQSNLDDVNLNMNAPRYTRENLTTPVRLQKYIPNNYGALKLHRLRCLEGILFGAESLLAIPRLYFHSVQDRITTVHRLELPIHETVLCHDQTILSSKNINITKLIDSGEFKIAAQCLRSTGIESDRDIIQAEMERLFPKYNNLAPKQELTLQEIAMIPVESTEVLRALKSIRSKTTTDIYGWNVHMLENAIISKKFTKLFTTLINDILLGKLNFNESKLICLKKKKGVRPIVIGSLFMKIAEKVIFARIGPSLGKYVNKYQYGVSIRNGCSAIAHNIRRQLDKGNLVFSIDFANAFNTINIAACLDDKPELRPYVNYFHTVVTSNITAISPSGNYEMVRGVPQGGVLSPILFCLGIHKGLESLQKNYPNAKIYAYLDDIYLSFEKDNIPPKDQLLTVIKRCFQYSHLQLNEDKCDFIIDTSKVLGIPLSYRSEDSINITDNFLQDINSLMNVSSKHGSYIMFKRYIYPKYQFFLRNTEFCDLNVNIMNQKFITFMDWLGIPRKYQCPTSLGGCGLLSPGLISRLGRKSLLFDMYTDHLINKSKEVKSAIQMVNTYFNRLPSFKKKHANIFRFTNDDIQGGTQRKLSLLHFTDIEVPGRSKHSLIGSLQNPPAGSQPLSNSSFSLMFNREIPTVPNNHGYVKGIRNQRHNQICHHICSLSRIAGLKVFPSEPLGANRRGDLLLTDPLHGSKIFDVTIVDQVKVGRQRKKRQDPSVIPLVFSEHGDLSSEVVELFQLITSKLDSFVLSHMFRKTKYLMASVLFSCLAKLNTEQQF
eukprot:TRINITY_DN3319_c3_g5_i2.p1 TRINITY_DN3319_c3_g5~~TRINITY_DN3319_c3_g5_i2.p1  ORF type:complete len:1466 (+),score=268.44 TRINITY_DN3319_c3_g5_i2:182-4399(+)